MFACIISCPVNMVPATGPTITTGVIAVPEQMVCGSKVGSASIDIRYCEGSHTRTNSETARSPDTT